MTENQTDGGIFDLPSGDRKKIDEALSEPLAPEPLTDDQRALLETRLTELEAEGGKFTSWAVVQQGLGISTDAVSSRGVELLDAAETDLRNVRDAFEAEREGLGQTFLEQIDQGFGRIYDQPSLADLVVGGLRRVGLLSFPYSVVYRMDEGMVQVVAVMRHTRRIDAGS